MRCSLAGEATPRLDVELLRTRGRRDAGRLDLLSRRDTGEGAAQHLAPMSEAGAHDGEEPRGIDITGDSRFSSPDDAHERRLDLGLRKEDRGRHSADDLGPRPDTRP